MAMRVGDGYVNESYSAPGYRDGSPAIQNGDGNARFLRKQGRDGNPVGADLRELVMSAPSHYQMDQVNELQRIRLPALATQKVFTELFPALPFRVAKIIDNDDGAVTWEAYRGADANAVDYQGLPDQEQRRVAVSEWGTRACDVISFDENKNDSHSIDSLKNWKEVKDGYEKAVREKNLDLAKAIFIGIGKVILVAAAITLIVLSAPILAGAVAGGLIVGAVVSGTALLVAGTLTLVWGRNAYKYAAHRYDMGPQIAPGRYQLLPQGQRSKLKFMGNFLGQFFINIQAIRAYTNRVQLASSEIDRIREKVTNAFDFYSEASRNGKLGHMITILERNIIHLEGQQRESILEGIAVELAFRQDQMRPGFYRQDVERLEQLRRARDDLQGVRDYFWTRELNLISPVEEELPAVVPPPVQAVVPPPVPAPAAEAPPVQAAARQGFVARGVNNVATKGKAAVLTGRAAVHTVKGAASRAMEPLGAWFGRGNQEPIIIG